MTDENSLRMMTDENSLIMRTDENSLRTRGQELKCQFAYRHNDKKYGCLIILTNIGFSYCYSEQYHVIYCAIYYAL